MGTPFYCYSTAILARHFDVLAAAVKPATVCFAVKSNSSLAVIRTLAARGAGADVVSEGELRVALKAGVPANKIVFSGVGKTERELVITSYSIHYTKLYEASRVQTPLGKSGMGTPT